MKNTRYYIILFLMILNLKLLAITLNYSGTFTNITNSVSGIVTINLNILPNDSIYGDVNFSDTTGGAAPLCGAGNFAGIRVSDSLLFSFISHDTDAGCGFDWGYLFILKAKLINGCDSITGHYYISSQEAGIYNLHKTNSASCPTGIEQFHENIFISVSPNPVLSQIKIEIGNNLEKSNQIEIQNMFGEKLSETKINQSKTTIDVSQLPSGIYFVKLQNEKVTIVKKFIKN
ncbi:MAG: T9SS type A sorting domain-containing protein [Bacteroidota bacterium]